MSVMMNRPRTQNTEAYICICECVSTKRRLQNLGLSVGVTIILQQVNKFCIHATTLHCLPFSAQPFALTFFTRLYTHCLLHSHCTPYANGHDFAMHKNINSRRLLTHACYSYAAVATKKTSHCLVLRLFSLIIKQHGW